MPNKKRIYQSISTKQSLPKKSNKIKLIFLCITFSFGMFLIIQNSKKIHLDGSWNATKIIINDQNLLLYDTIFRNFDISNQYISIWGHSIKINPNEQKIIADFKIEKDNQGNNYMIL
ncbi:MAG: hypothetical protein ABI892_15505, partial [Flavobacterium sp.]